ncbi:MAG: asparagine--tRNA ligase [Nanoarchaeota archaeon]|nr:asparagine--tRNA ligase [Nanoarchaeota archaeon]
MKRVFVSEALKKNGSVLLKGWVYRIRKSKNLVFIILRDSTGIIQCTVKNDNPYFNVANALTIESSIEVIGKTKTDARAVTGVEVVVNKVHVFQNAEKYPITKDKSTEHLMDYRHLWLRSQKMIAILKIREQVLKSFRDWYFKNDYHETNGPMFVGTKGEEGGELFELDYFGQPGYLTQTSQMHLEALIFALGKVFTISPTFRAEKSRTRKHLTEFLMMEGEMPFYNLSMALKDLENMIVFVCREVAKNCDKELLSIGQDPKYLLSIKAPFEKKTYETCIDELRKKGSKIKYGEDIKTEDEQLLMKGRKSFLFITHWPRELKAFYMKVSDNAKTVECYDLQAPSGFGEIVGGSERETDIKEIVANLEREGDDPKRYEWYLDLRRYGSVPHAGYGLGVARFVAWLTNAEHVRDAVPFPRFINRLKP